MTLEEMNLACERLEAAQACRNLVGKLSYFDSAFRMKDLLALWDNSDEAELRLPDETHQGFEAVKAALEARGDRDDAGMDVKMRGTLVIHNMNSDALEISPDAKTAHGTWFSPGIETDLYDPKAPDAVPDKHDTAKLEASANYVWQEYGLDFVRREDGWKIQKLKVRTFFDTPFDTPWSQTKDTMWTPDAVVAEM